MTSRAPSPDTPAIALAALRWLRFDVTVCCVGNPFARSHPLAVLGGLLMYAAPRTLKPEHQPRGFLFRPHQATGDRVHKDSRYSFSVLLPHAQPDEAALFIAALQQPLRNFELCDLSPVTERSLADLEQENPCPDGIDEICLDLLTPFPLTGTSSGSCNASASGFGNQLADLLKRRLRLAAAPVIDWARFHLLAHFAREARIGQPSARSKGQWVTHGIVGPLYLRGPLAEIWPLLLLAAEIPLGDAKIGGGSLVLRKAHSFFSTALHNPTTYRTALEELSENTDVQDDFKHALRDADEIGRELAEAVRSGSWRNGAAQAHRLRKSDGRERMIAVLPPRDYVLHKALHAVLAPWFDRTFEPAAVGYRPGVTPGHVQARIRAGYREGRVWALRADIEDFFDQIDWDQLTQQLARAIPRADAQLLALLDTLIRLPLQRAEQIIPRERGLVQGSPLSPLLANVFLDSFDEALAARGLYHIRFADDLLVLCPSEAEAREALRQVEAELATRGLRLNPDKTEILSADAGFQYLGRTHGGGLDPAAVAEARTRRTLYVRDYRAWVGVDHDAITIRTGTELLARVPLRRLNGIVLLGGGGISTRALDRCNDWSIPLVFCSARGRPINALAPRNREHFAVGAQHGQRHAELLPEELMQLAAAIVEAKLHNHLRWLDEFYGDAARTAAATIADSLRALPRAQTIEQLRGYEGLAARAMFRFVNDRAGEAWRSEGRIPHERPDIWNALLDLLSHLLFCRLLVLTLQHGLNPWLGFLHSAANRYESLICDLQEPFRARLERFALKLTNLRMLKPEDFEPHPYGGARLKAEASALMLERWERELMTRYSGDPAHLLGLLEAQVLSLKAWVCGRPFTVYRMARTVSKPPRIKPDSAAPTVKPDLKPKCAAPPAEGIQIDDGKDIAANK